MPKSKLLFTGTEWTFDTIQRTHDALEKIAKSEFKLNTYPNQIEVITFEQMLDNYATIGMPLMYHHWSFGKKWIEFEKEYAEGNSHLAYELVINSSPCINYIMEENTMTTQALVLGHAAFGHNHFFKNNYLFKLWTNADAIIDYANFAKEYIRSCELKYGVREVEKVLDAAHALREQGINRYIRPVKLSMDKEKERQQERERYLETQINDLWRTVPHPQQGSLLEDERFPKDPEENILYFIEKYSPILEPWQREIVRIVRKFSQYFYPQTQTKVMNEGFASFIHYHLMNELYRQNYVEEGTMLEFIKLHTNVLNQLPFSHRYYHGLNPYVLGYNILQDIKRICLSGTEEDHEWVKGLKGQDWREVVLDIVENYRDESFVLQFLSPKMIREMRLFVLQDDTSDRTAYTVETIHNEQGYQDIRKQLSESFQYNAHVPDVQVYNVDIKGDRRMFLRYYLQNDGKHLHRSYDDVARKMVQLWGHQIQLETWDKSEGRRLYFVDIRGQ